MNDDDDLTTIMVGEPRGADEVASAQWPTDEACAAAVDLARAALLAEVEPVQVGDTVGLVAEGPLVVTHYFAAQVPGYAGWRWAVTVTRAPDSDAVTVDETALLPDQDALLAPVWVPWKNRIESGDLGAGDVMVTEPDDPRLMPGMSTNDLVDPEADDEVLPRLWELGLGRERMLSPQGRSEAAHRWYREVGPRSQIARAAELHCTTCGFLLLMGGPLGQAFGVCANGFSPVDGHVVALDFGCGAHSETVQQPLVAVAEMLIDEVGYDEAGSEGVTGADSDADEPADSESDEPADSESDEPADSDADEPGDSQPDAWGAIADQTDTEAAEATETAAVSGHDAQPPDSAEQAVHETMHETLPEEGS